MTKKELVGCICGIIALISICFGVYFWFETRYAHADDVYRDMQKAMEVIQKVNTKLDYQIIDIELRGVQQRIYTIEDRYCPNKSKPCDESKMPQTVREEYRNLKERKEELKSELKILQDETRK